MTLNKFNKAGKIWIDILEDESIANNYNDWYGIDSIKFVPHGCYSDPEIIYGKYILNQHVVLDVMCEDFEQAKDEEYISKDMDFDDYMLEEADTVKEYIEEYAYYFREELLDREIEIELKKYIDENFCFNLFDETLESFFGVDDSSITIYSSNDEYSVDGFTYYDMGIDADMISYSLIFDTENGIVKQISFENAECMLEYLKEKTFDDLVEMFYEMLEIIA